MASNDHDDFETVLKRALQFQLIADRNLPGQFLKKLKGGEYEPNLEDMELATDVLFDFLQTHDRIPDFEDGKDMEILIKEMPRIRAETYLLEKKFNEVIGPRILEGVFKVINLVRVGEA